MSNTKEFMLAAIVIGIVIGLASQALAQGPPKGANGSRAKRTQSLFYDAKGNEITKLQAIRTMILEPNATVRRCTDLELSPEGKVRGRK